MEPVSSSEDSSDSDNNSSEYSSSDTSFDAPEEFEDLPSDDSCLNDDDEDEEDDDDEELSTSSLPFLGNQMQRSHSRVTEQDLNLGERMHVIRHERGKTIPGSVKEQRKEKALQIAHDRLEFVRKRKASTRSVNRDQSSSDNSSDDESSDSSNPEEKTAPDERKKRSKHAPACASSRRSSYFKHVDINSSGLGVHIGAKKYKPQDPRFQSLSGYLNQDVFDKRFSFLEEKVDGDIERLQKNIAILRQGGKQGKRKRKKLGLESSQLQQDEAELKRLLHEKASRRQEHITRAAKQSVKRKIQEDVASGKRGAYYLKRKDRKKLEMEARLDELRKVGGDEAVAKALAKRRKKKMSKHSSLMPKVK